MGTQKNCLNEHTKHMFKLKVREINIMGIRSLSGPMKLSDILDTPSPLIRVNACMYEYMPHMCIFVTALSNMPLIIDFELKKVLLPPPPREFCRHILS